MNLLARLRVFQNEVIMSRALKCLIEGSPTFAKRFLADMFGAIEPNDVAVDIEYSVGDLGRLDLVIRWVDLGAEQCAIIEHKIHAGEGKDQTERYAEAAAGVVMDVAPSMAAEGRPCHLAMLTPWPWEIAQSESFSAKTHEAILPALQAAASDPDPAIRELAGSWAQELRDFYGAGVGEGHADWARAVAAETPGGLNKGLLVVQRLRQPLQERLEGTGLLVGAPYRGSGRGRSWIAIKVEKHDRAWRASRQPQTGDQIGVHLHAQIHLPLDGSSDPACYLVLELEPYMPRKAAERTFGVDFVAGYKADRTRFISHVRESLKSSGWRVNDNWNYLASRRVAGGALSLADVATSSARSIVACEQLLDDAWSRVFSGDR